ncbi:MAG TPA: MerR family DNA-binding protein [Candidatus Micrarchaeia archaeon]|nr:MerR family DNA-binding protein [Candidatus Micrarchaeia archaeon]
MRSAEMAAEAGVNVQSLRYYERRGLLRQPARLASGYRSYAADDVRTVRFIRCAQRLGFTLTEIGALLELAAGGPASCEAAKQMAEEKLGQLKERMATLGTMGEALQRLAATCDRPRARRDCPLLQAIGDASAASADHGR